MIMATARTISAPTASAVRSTALVVTVRPASSCICRRPSSNGADDPTTANMRRTPGESSVRWISNSTSAAGRHGNENTNSMAAILSPHRRR